MRGRGYVISWDGIYSTIAKAGKDDDGQSFAKCKRELRERWREEIASRKEALATLRKLTPEDLNKSSVTEVLDELTNDDEPRGLGTVLKVLDVKGAK